jgi:type II secretory pathway pseudopilin PulG
MSLSKILAKILTNPSQQSATKRRNRQAGFSLIEAAIVLAVAGLLIGGALQGQTLIENARIQSVVDQVQGYRTAVTTFQDKYNALPGNFSEATTRLNASLVNGGGTGTLGTTMLSANSTENVQFWQHLAAANLVTGVYARPEATNTDAKLGKEIPATRLGGGIVAVVADGSSTSNSVAIPRGTWLRIGDGAPTTAAGSGTTSGDFAENAILTPDQAYQIDKSLDDGNPRTGKVMATGTGCATGTAPNFSYDGTSSDRNCLLFVAL